MESLSLTGKQLDKKEETTQQADRNLNENAHAWKPRPKLNINAFTLNPTGPHLNANAPQAKHDLEYLTANDTLLKLERRKMNESNTPLKPIRREHLEGNENPMKPYSGNLKKNNSPNTIPLKLSQGKQKDAETASGRLAFKQRMLGMSLPHDGENCTKVLPQALIIGVMKCGTETLATFLAVHPDIAMQMKVQAVEFFNLNYRKGYEWYRNQMPCSTEGQITIEKSPQYLTAPYGPKRIKKMDNNIKLILSVREPIKRAISHYDQGRLISGRFSDTFEDTVINTAGGIDGNHEVLQRSLYSVQLKRWLDYFKLEQIHIVDAENFKINPAEELNKVEDFLGIRQYFTQKSFTFSEERGFFCLNLPNGDEACMAKGKGRTHQEVSPAMIERLKEFYKPYNEEFFDIVGRRFNWTF